MGNKYCYASLIILINLVFFQECRSQTADKNYPRVGREISDYTFSDNGDSKVGNIFSISDYRGKWVILDFWTKECVNCIKSFPKMNSLSKNFENEVKVIMVGHYSTKKYRAQTIEQIESRREKYDLNFTVVYDSLLLNQYDIGSVPHILLVNPDGVLVAKMLSIDSAQLSAFIKGKRPAYLPTYASHEPRPVSSYDYNKLLPDKNDIDRASAPFFRALFVSWDSTQPISFVRGFDVVSEVNNMINAEAIGLPLPYLLRLGYTGKTFWSTQDELYYSLYQGLVLRSVDSTLFESYHNNKRNAFSYSLTLPDNKLNIMEIRGFLLADIERFFHIKTRLGLSLVPVLELRVIDSVKVAALKTKGEKPLFERNSYGLGLICRNMSISQMIEGNIFSQTITRIIKFNSSPPIYDLTNIGYNIDLKLNADPYDFAETNRALKTNGLELKLVDREMNCIIIEQVKK